MFLCMCIYGETKSGCVGVFMGTLKCCCVCVFLGGGSKVV